LAPTITTPAPVGGSQPESGDWPRAPLRAPCERRVGPPRRPAFLRAAEPAATRQGNPQITQISKLSTARFATVSRRATNLPPRAGRVGGRPAGSRLALRSAVSSWCCLQRTHTASVCSKGSSSVGEHHADVLLRSPPRRMLTIECFRPCDEHALCRSVVEPIDFWSGTDPAKMLMLSPSRTASRKAKYSASRQGSCIASVMAIGSA